MIRADCDIVRPLLEAFVDGELRGPQVRLVLQHLDHCLECGQEVEELRLLGETLRDAIDDQPSPAALAGLAGRVTGRIAAEGAASWKAVLVNASEDWHWLIVGSGSVAATFFCTVVVSAMLAFGAKPERTDSLSALMTNLGSPAGVLFVYVPPDGVDTSGVLLQVDDGAPLASRTVKELALSGMDRSAEAALVDALATAVTSKGRSLSLDRMHPADRKYAEALLTEIQRLRLAAPAAGLDVGNIVAIQDFRLVTTTTVSAKAL